MGWNDAIRDYFTFTRKERIGLLLIIIVIIVVFFTPMFFKKRNVAEITLIDSALIKPLKASTTTAETDENDFDDNQTSHYQFDSSAGIPWIIHHQNYSPLTPILFRSQDGKNLVSATRPFKRS
jgi:hypothetical protein